jgi:diketogulonate reductase-like aldo/keto reductase
VHTIPANGAEIPAIGLGTWPLRGRECARAVATAIAAGYRHIDTAASYGNEDGVGEGIRISGVARDALFITTKVPQDLAGGPFQRSLEASLKRLGLDRVDLVLIHWPSARLPVAETIAALNDVKRKGLARHIGVSNFTVRHLAEAWAATKEPLAANQCEYHPYLNQDRVIEACRARGMAFIAYSPVGRGLAFIANIARRKGKTPAQVVLRWEVQQKNVAAIPKSGDPARIRENLDIFDFSLDDAEMAAISALTQTHHERICDSSWVPWDS